MRRFLTALWVLVLAGAAHADNAVTILHTNDIHARFEPVNRFGGTCSAPQNAEGVCYGGSARLMTAIAEARLRAPDALLLDAGDQFQGSLFYTHHKGRFVAQMMHHMGYDAMAVGNHEFDDGPEALRRFVDAVDFPVLMANADLSQEPLLAGAIPRSVVIERGGARIGLIGIVPPDTGASSSPGKAVRFLDPVVPVQAEVDRLEALGVNRIVLLSHSGLGVDLWLAEAVRGLDVVIGGHSHTLLGPGGAGPYPIWVGQTAIVQAGAHGRYLGELVVHFDAEGVVIKAHGAPRSLDASVAEDPVTLALVRAAATPLEALRAQAVGAVTGPVDGSRSCRRGVCAMGVLVAEAMLERGRGQGAELAIQNGGGLRDSFASGEVTMGQVMTVLPFQNTLSIFRLNGAALWAALEHGVGGAGTGRFPQVAGLRLSYDPGADAGARLREVWVGDAPLDPARLYTVVTNSYLRGGGDGYTMFQEAQDAYDHGPDLAEVLAEYLAAQGPYIPVVDDRVRQVAE